MSRSMMFGAAALAALITAPVTTAIAQDITVTGPRIDQRSEPGSTLNIQKVSVSERVSFGDLDLGTYAGRQELNARVAIAARMACRRVEKINRGNIPLSYDEPCYRDAMADARDQIYQAIQFGG